MLATLFGKDEVEAGAKQSAIIAKYLKVYIVESRIR